MSSAPRICAVSYLNTVPLVWGMLHGDQRDQCRLSFAVPSECADLVEQGAADLGIVPVVEVQRQGLAVVPGAGIACYGPVRSILLVSRVRPERIRTLAADIGSRTSIALARLLLRQRFGADPHVTVMAPSLEAMLERADAALLIGDAALRLEPTGINGQVLDLGEQWCSLTGLPMVFAVWAGKPDRVQALREANLEQLFRRSLQFGLENLNTIVQAESRSRGLSEDLVRRYLTEHVVFDLGQKELEGMELFLSLARESESLLTSELIQKV